VPKNESAQQSLLQLNKTSLFCCVNLDTVPKKRIRMDF